MNKKTLIIAIVIIIVLALAIWWYINANMQRQARELLTAETTDTMDSINKDLNSVDLGNLEVDFTEIDNDINSL